MEEKKSIKKPLQGKNRQNPQYCYECYKHNIFQLIKFYDYKPHWFYIDEHPFYNFTSHKPNNFVDLGDPFLLQFKTVKTDLAADILQKGMYTPFFYYIGKKGEKVLLLGKHRLFSLLRYHQTISPIDKKFLFLEVPHNPQSVTKELLEPQNYTNPVYYFDENLYPELKNPKHKHDVDEILLITGDSLSRIIYGCNIVPSPLFNIEGKLEEVAYGGKLIKF